MKSRFSTIDISVVIRELLRFVSMRVMNVYDVDNKTYLIRLGKPDDKAVIVLESGIKIHSTEFDWPKNPAPSGFSMKMRKHLKGRRLESVVQLGIDRIIDLTFGSSDAAYHVILELYDRGNIVLTDWEYTILNILRPRTDTCQDVKFAVREKYPLDTAKQHQLPTEEKLRELILAAKEGDTLKKVLIPHMDYGPAIIEHVLLGVDFPDNVKIGKGFDITKDMYRLMVAIEEAEDLLKILSTEPCKGFVTQKVEKRPNAKEGEPKELLTYEEFHPMLFRQHQKKAHLEFDSFNKAVDQFYSQTESQKIELKTLQQERTALKKLDNIKKDHERRVEDLQKEQEKDMLKGQLIELNLSLVDRAILIVRSAVANQIDWTEIKNLVKEAQMDGDPVASAIKELHLDTNHMTLLLHYPYEDSDFEDDDDAEETEKMRPMRVDINLSLSAYANSRKFFEKKKHAAVKEQKTLDASTKALKSAEKKTKETLKEVATAASINKARKTHWFEKFLWFISSENYLVIGGRDQQQNELIVKRHMRQGDVYVHADLHGASSVIIKNPTREAVPPKTLNEAGTMAICNSAAWDAKVVTSAWWVHPEQVSKTAPSGEYLSTGSFMIRGRKNYLPPSYLVYGFGYLFKLEEGSVARHEGERKVRTLEDDQMSVADSVADSEITMETSSDVELEIDGSDESDEEDAKDCDTVQSSVEDCEVTVKQEPDCENATETDISEKDGEKCDCECPGQTKSAEKKSKAAPAFPDTEINLQHVKGDKYELSRIRTDSYNSNDSESATVYLGDDIPVVFGEKTSHSGAKLSAKQRREMKKAKKASQPLSSQPEETQDAEEEDRVSWLQEESQGRRRRGKEHKESSSEEQQQQPKRGQKAKQRKMKEKYWDQDEEERQMKMEILASAGAKKEDKKKKGKKGQEKGRPASAQGKGRPQSSQNKQQPQSGKKKPELIDIVIQEVSEMTAGDAPLVEGQKPEKDKDQKTEKDVQVEGGNDDGEDEAQVTTDDLQALNSLTGIPMTEDELLFAIPVCAPYNALTNYKYKVKLLPGSTKRGKASKMAINMFLQDRNTTSREKDLLKILKDADMARNMPGKVKVTAPHLHKTKKK